MNLIFHFNRMDQHNIHWKLLNENKLLFLSIAGEGGGESFKLFQQYWFINVIDLTGSERDIFGFIGYNDIHQIKRQSILLPNY